MRHQLIMIFNCFKIGKRQLEPNAVCKAHTCFIVNTKYNIIVNIKTNTINVKS